MYLLSRRHISMDFRGSDDAQSGKPIIAFAMD
jgi:hypothetical protein